jgi:hypothetical protein
MGEKEDENPWTAKNIALTIILGVAIAVVGAYIIQDARFDPTRLKQDKTDEDVSRNGVPIVPSPAPRDGIGLPEPPEILGAYTKHGTYDEYHLASDWYTAISYSHFSDSERNPGGNLENIKTWGLDGLHYLNYGLSNGCKIQNTVAFLNSAENASEFLEWWLSAMDIYDFQAIDTVGDQAVEYHTAVSGLPYKSILFRRYNVVIRSHVVQCRAEVGANWKPLQFNQDLDVYLVTSVHE